MTMPLIDILIAVIGIVLVMMFIIVINKKSSTLDDDTTVTVSIDEYDKLNRMAEYEAAGIPLDEPPSIIDTPNLAEDNNESDSSNR